MAGSAVSGLAMARLVFLALVWQAACDQGSPLIGVFSLPVSGPHAPQICDGNASSCEMLPASYVRFIESAGGQVVPINIDTTDEDMNHLIDSLNGFLFTGGPDMDPPRHVQQVLRRSRQAHEEDDAGGIPVWGTCLGFEWMIQAVAPEALEAGFNASNVNLPLQLQPAASSSRLLGQAPQSVLDALTLHRTAFNNHHRGVRPEAWKLPVLNRTLQILATSLDEDGKTFVSAVEGVDGLPWFGVQFHPEKNIFEHGLAADGRPVEDIPHSPQAVLMTQYLANFFVEQARGNSRSFANETEEAGRLIYGRETTRRLAPFFQEVYIFQSPQVPSHAELLSSFVI